MLLKHKKDVSLMLWYCAQLNTPPKCDSSVLHRWWWYRQAFRSRKITSPQCARSNNPHMRAADSKQNPKLRNKKKKEKRKTYRKNKISLCPGKFWQKFGPLGDSDGSRRVQPGAVRRFRFGRWMLDRKAISG